MDQHKNNMDRNQPSRSEADSNQSDQDRPNQNANKEPAEGSRDTARANEGVGDANAFSQRRDVTPSTRESGNQGDANRNQGQSEGQVGISNRDLDTEQEVHRQKDLP